MAYPHVCYTHPYLPPVPISSLCVRIPRYREVSSSFIVHLIPRTAMGFAAKSTLLYRRHILLTSHASSPEHQSSARMSDDMGGVLQPLRVHSIVVRRAECAHSGPPIAPNHSLPCRLRIAVLCGGCSLRPAADVRTPHARY